MSIERLIYGSFPLGIESDTPGYQELTYTKGYLSIKEANKDIHGRIITTYSAPETICYTDWYSNKLAEEMASGADQIRIANEASRMAKTDHPACLTYYHESVNGVNKSVFVYGKGMLDWSMRGGIASYHSAVICDDKDITRYPIFYGSSSVVCCDIMREDLFPDNGTTIKAPAMLKDLPSLDSPNDIQIKHAAGFEPFALSDIISFIREEDRLSILESMISSIIQLKSGDSSKRIVIADKNENIPLWIAAISYIFPLPLSLSISFSTYSYNVKELDITGVFVAELNGAKRISDDIEVTGYNFNDLNQSYSVYDFSIQRFGENVQTYDNLFISLIENSYTINAQILEQFKSYITSATTYKAINTEYMDGAILFMFIDKSKRLNAAQMASALSFSKKYSTINEKRRIVDKLLQLYSDYLSDSASIESIIDYIRNCVSDNVIYQEEIEKKFLSDVVKAFADYNTSTFDMFSEQGRITEKFCGYAEGQLEIAFVKAVGLNSLCKQIEALHKIGDAQRISYIHTSLAHYVSAGHGSYKAGQIERDIECKILSVFINGDTKDNADRLEALNKKTEKIITITIPMFFYYDTVFSFLVEMNCRGLAKTVAERIYKTYISISSVERQNYITALNTCKHKEIYIPFILQEIEKEYRSTEKINLFLQMITNNPRELNPYVSEIKELCLSNDDETTDSNYYYKVLLILVKCKEAFKIPLKANEVTSVIEEYINHLYSEHRDYVLPSDKILELKSISNMCSLQRISPSSANLAYTFLIADEMRTHLADKGQNVFNGYNPIVEVDYEELSYRQQQALVDTFSKYISEYWLNTKKFPHLQKLFVFQSAANRMKAYSELFSEILEHVIDSNSRNRSEVMVSIIEYAIYLGLSQFLDNSPDLLVEKVKPNDILKPLEKDIELKTRLKAQNDLLSQIDAIELQQEVARIREAYEQKSQNSALERAKKAFGSFMSGFKKGKKDDQ